jgi:hypothetical protein
VPQRSLADGTPLFCDCLEHEHFFDTRRDQCIPSGRPPFASAAPGRSSGLGVEELGGSPASMGTGGRGDTAR